MGGWVHSPLGVDATLRALGRFQSFNINVGIFWMDFGLALNRFVPRKRSERSSFARFL